MLKITDLSGGYNDMPTVQNISFQVDTGENVYIIGPNGSGKTTLFKLVLNLLKKTSGCVLLDHKPKDNHYHIAKHIAYIPQSHEQPFDYTVFEMVLMGRASDIGMFSKPTVQDKKKAMGAIEMLDIVHLKDSIFNHLSGGEMKMALIARSICTNAKIIVMDEPFSNLDYKNCALINQTMFKLNSQGYSFLISTHNITRINCGANVLLLKDGKSQAFANAKDIINSEKISALYGTNLIVKQIETDDGQKEFIII
jgi:iron complex transport system ATP-binding protein